MKAGPTLLTKWGLTILAGLLLAGSISYISPRSLSFNEQLNPGRYSLEINRHEDQDAIEGPVYFEYTGQNDQLIATRIFKLHFVNSNNSGEPGFGFLIPLSDTEEGVGPIEYQVDPERRGFMNGFGTVFGYADLRGASPALYFTESGSISILTTSPEEVSGNIDMLLDDGNGNSIRLSGSFRALPLPPDLGLN